MAQRQHSNKQAQLLEGAWQHSSNKAIGKRQKQARVPVLSPSFRFHCSHCPCFPSGIARIGLFELSHNLWGVVASPVLATSLSPLSFTLFIPRSHVHVQANLLSPSYNYKYSSPIAPP